MPPVFVHRAYLHLPPFDIHFWCFPQSRPALDLQYFTAEWEPCQWEPFLRFASVPLRKIGTELLGSWWPCQCALPIETRLEPRPRLKPDEWELRLLDNGKSRSLRADARRTNTLCFKTQAKQQGAESEPVQAYLPEFLSLADFLSKIETHLLASLGSKEKNRT